MASWLWGYPRPAAVRAYAHGGESPASPREGLMANKSQGTWYVSFERPRGKRTLLRATETFPNEREAKQFARAKLVDTPNVTAGTLNPHLPKRTTQIVRWLEQRDGPDASK